MDDAKIAFTDDVYRRRSQALQGINEMFNELLDILDESGGLENTIGMAL